MVLCGVWVLVTHLCGEHALFLFFNARLNLAPQPLSIQELLEGVGARDGFKVVSSIAIIPTRRRLSLAASCCCRRSLALSGL